MLMLLILNQSIQKQYRHEIIHSDKFKFFRNNSLTLVKVMNAIHLYEFAWKTVFKSIFITCITLHSGILTLIMDTAHCSIRHTACPRRALPHNGRPGGAAASGGKTAFRPFALCGGDLRARRHAGAYDTLRHVACLLAIL